MIYSLVFTVMLIITAAKTDLKCSLFIEKSLDDAKEYPFRPRITLLSISKILDLTTFGQLDDHKISIKLFYWSLVTSLVG